MKGTILGYPISGAYGLTGRFRVNIFFCAPVLDRVRRRLLDELKGPFPEANLEYFSGAAELTSAHRLRPKFIRTLNGDFSDLVSVLKKMIRDAEILPFEAP